MTEYNAGSASRHAAIRRLIAEYTEEFNRFLDEERELRGMSARDDTERMRTQLEAKQRRIQDLEYEVYKREGEA